MIDIDLLELMLTGESNKFFFGQKREEVEKLWGYPSDTGGVSKKFTAPSILSYFLKGLDCQVFLDTKGHVTIGVMIVIKDAIENDSNIVLANRNLLDLVCLSEDTAAILKRKICLSEKKMISMQIIQRIATLP